MRSPKSSINARVRLGLVALALCLGLGAGAVARAAPGNDDFAHATRIEALPFSTVQDASGATLQPNEPYWNCGGGSSVWFRFTPSTNTVLSANTFGSNYDTRLDVYTGNSLARLTLVACDDDSGGTQQSKLSFHAAAGVTYHFRVSQYGSRGTLQFNLSASPTSSPPFNDHFADAVEITDQPFFDVRDTTAATMESGEPMPCGLGSASVWYRITLSERDLITPNTYLSDYDTVLAAYRDTGIGTGFERLVLETCNDDSSPAEYQSSIAFSALPFITYYFQVGTYGTTGGGSLHFNLIHPD